MKKNVIFAAVVLLIVGAIWYLEGAKAGPVAPSENAAPVATATISALAGPGSPTSTSTASAALEALAAADQKAGRSRAVQLTDPTGFVNTDAFSLSDFVGKKVVLLDFWTYSCINCIRTIPYLESWYEKYKNDGLVIVGVHTPEFDFEKNYANVAAAVKKFGITYPVVLDSDYGTWTAYGNLYWPHEYLIDLAGYVVHDHVGEGDYPATEAEIQGLLSERANVLGAGSSAPATSTVAIPSENLAGIESPETYFGAMRNEYLGNGTQSVQGAQTLAVPAKLSPNTLYLGGTWDFESEYATNRSAGAKVVYRYRSAKVYLVADAPGGATVTVLRDGKPIDPSVAGSDVHDGTVEIKESRLYGIVDDPAGSGEHTLELDIETPGLDAYTFTFG